jgi:superfamily I DNA and/or RNA helicase
MAVLFLDFYNNLRVRNGNNKVVEKNIYNTPLEEQFELINSRLPLKARYNDFRSLIQESFPSGLPKKYYLSCPNYIREFEDKGTVSFLNNVVLRSELGSQSRFGDNKSIILVGDIVLRDTLRSFRVKGIEIIDEGFTKSGEKVIQSSHAVYAFEYNKWSRREDPSKSYFTPNILLDLTQNNYPVKNPEIVQEFYDKWNEYTKFREYYLETQTDRHYVFQNVEYIQAYSMNKRKYRKNEDIYSMHLLDNNEEFSKGQQVILNEQFDDTDSFHLIRVDVEFNREEFNSHNIEKGNKIRNEVEASLRSFARENVALSSSIPNRKNYNYILKQSYLLDSRFKIIKTEIEPDCVDIEISFDKKIRNEKEQIDRVYTRKIENETKQYIKTLTNDLEQQDNKILNDYSKDLLDKFEQDVIENTDKTIRDKYEKAIKVKQNKLKNELQQQEKKIKDKIKKTDKEQMIEKLKSDLQVLQEKYSVLINNVYQTVDLRRWYEERNNNLVVEKEKSLTSLRVQKIEKNRINKIKELTAKYDNQYQNEKVEAENRLKVEMNQEIEKRIKEESITRFSIYFKTDPEVQNKAMDGISRKRYLIYNNRAEAAKIERQRNALDSFFEGNVKNPYLSTYLFAPEELSSNTYDHREWNWFLDKLNDKQKEAVMRAVSSNGVFLLQGPPGTGKTQVISEIVGHLVKEGKKVLISSETHKAIDNVFERLPKIAEIRPIRLITTQSKKESEFSPSNLVDNLYHNIAGQLEKTIVSYENFTEYKDKFNDEKNKLKLLQSRLVSNKEDSKRIAQEISILEQEYSTVNESRSSVEDQKERIQVEKEMLYNTYKMIENNQLIEDDEDIEMIIMSEYREKVLQLLQTEIFNTNDIDKTLRLIQQMKSSEIKDEINVLLSNQDDFTRKQELNKIKTEILDLMDKYDLDHPKVKAKQQEFAEYKKLDSSSNNNLSNLNITKIFNSDFLSDSSDKAIIEFEKVQITLLKLKNMYKDLIQLEQKKKDDELSNVNDSLKEFSDSLKELSNKIILLREESSYNDYQESKNKLEVALEKFFKDFDLVTSYNSVDEAISVIETEWESLQTSFGKREEENKQKIPMYKRIASYLTNEEVILEDRKKYTKPLFSLVNLYGSTTTSRDHFSERAMSDLSDYNLGDIDLKKQGIDVVIIDEVSKSSFIELLIPILYGKTVILVGDHRQLPPMYEYRNFRYDDFDGLDEAIINKHKNDQFTEMYEESFFKTLFEKVPMDYKVMLTKQYRCHEHIMNVFNHFYNNNLQLGLKTQNLQKKHYLNIDGVSRRIIEQDKHIYFIDSKGEESRRDDSTSIQNNGEADIVVELLKKIDTAYSNSTEFKPYVNKQKRIDERMSVGVICTYGDQAALIKQKSKGMKFRSFNENSDSRLVISTVDDFQGDERDIIIVSMVRSPQNHARSKAGFITAYQRVNVAFSRARRILIIVGNKDYLIKKGVIDLPDVMGDQVNDKKDFRIYEKVIDTIRQDGKMLDDADIFVGGVR